MEGSKKIPLLNLGDQEITVSERLAPNFYLEYGKALFDLLFAWLLLPILLPVIAVLMLSIKLSSRGPAIYRSERVGKDGKKFPCFKLRSMHLDADQRLQQLLQENPQLRKEFEQYCKLKDDPRVTRLGSILRATSLDELPQIFNILRGEMSFVGPRPVPEDELHRYYRNNLKIYTSVVPGITGLWQVSGRSDIAYDERIRLDERYACEQSFAFDFEILVKTLPAALGKKGAY